MKALSLYLTSFNRYRRSRGFGVHSPFAYYFIKRVIKESCHYYSYQSIDCAAEKEGVSRRDTRLLFRVANYLNPAAMLMAGESRAALTALKSVSASIPVTYSVSDADAVTRYLDSHGVDRPFVYIDPTARFPYETLLQLSRDVINSQGTLVIGGMKRGNLMRRLLKDTESGMKYGMTFSNGTMAIIIGDCKLPRQRFALWF